MRKGHSAALRKGRESIPGQIYHIRFSTKNRTPLFDFQQGCKLAKLIHKAHADYRTGSLCWVIMPDHIHLLSQLGQEVSLSQLVRKIKSDYTRMTEATSLWQDGFFDRALRKEDDLKAVARYIIANPIRAGLVQSVRDYSLWDACWI